MDDLKALQNKVDFLEAYIRMMLLSGVRLHGNEYLFDNIKDKEIKAKCMEQFVKYMNDGYNITEEFNFDAKADYVNKTLQ